MNQIEMTNIPQDFRVRPIVFDTLLELLGDNIVIKERLTIWIGVLETILPVILVQCITTFNKYQNGQLFSTTFENFIKVDKLSIIGFLIGIIIYLLHVIFTYDKIIKKSDVTSKGIIKDLEQEISTLEKSLCSLYEKGFPIQLRIMNSMEKNSRICSMVNPSGVEKSKHCANDKHIMSPLAYCYNIVSQLYEPPPFHPDARYIEALFDKGTKNVVAITGADPCMWLDPILLFYLINTGLLSVSYDFNRIFDDIKDPKESCNHRIKFTSKRTDEGFVKFEKEKLNLLTKLTEKTNFTSKGEFVSRFFILRSEEINNYKDSFLPGLVAIHDMFRIRTYFIKAEGLLDELERRNSKLEYNNLVDSIYKKFNHENLRPLKCINGLNQPEFLIFPEQLDDGASQIYSYKNGSLLSGVDSPESQDSLNLVRMIAEICLEHDKYDLEFWYKTPGGDETNKNNCLFELI